MGSAVPIWEFSDFWSGHYRSENNQVILFDTQLKKLEIDDGDIHARKLHNPSSGKLSKVVLVWIAQKRMNKNKD